MESGGQPEGAALIIYYNLTCNGREVGTYNETILAGLGGIGCDFLRREGDRNVVPSSLMVKGRNILQLNILIIITNITENTYSDDYSDHYYGIRSKEDFYCKVKPLDRDLDGIYDAVDPLLINNFLASFMACIVGVPLSMVAGRRLSKMARLMKKR